MGEAFQVEDTGVAVLRTNPNGCRGTGACHQTVRMHERRGPYTGSRAYTRGLPIMNIAHRHRVRDKIPQRAQPPSDGRKFSVQHSPMPRRATKAAECELKRSEENPVLGDTGFAEAGSPQSANTKSQPGLTIQGV